MREPSLCAVVYGALFHRAVGHNLRLVRNRLLRQQQQQPASGVAGHRSGRGLAVTGR